MLKSLILLAFTFLASTSLAQEAPSEPTKEMSEADMAEFERQVEAENQREQEEQRKMLEAVAKQNAMLQNIAEHAMKMKDAFEKIGTEKLEAQQECLACLQKAFKSEDEDSQSKPDAQPKAPQLDAAQVDEEALKKIEAKEEGYYLQKFQKHKARLHAIARSKKNNYFKLQATTYLLAFLDTNHKDYQAYATELFTPETFACSNRDSCEEVLDKISALMEKIPERIIDEGFYQQLQRQISWAVKHPFYRDHLLFNLDIIYLKSSFIFKTSFYKPQQIGLTPSMDPEYIELLSEKLYNLRTSLKNPLVKYDLTDLNSVILYNLASKEDFDEHGKLSKEKREEFELFLDSTPPEFLEQQFTQFSLSFAEELLYKLNFSTYDLEALELYVQRTANKSPMSFLKKYYQPYLNKNNLEYNSEEGLIHPITLSLLLAKFNTVEYRTAWGYHFANLAGFFANNLKAEDFWLTSQTAVGENDEGEEVEVKKVPLNNILGSKFVEYFGYQGKTPEQSIDGIWNRKRAMVQEYNLPALDDTEVSTLEQKEQWLAEHLPGFNSLMYELNDFDKYSTEIQIISAKSEEIAENAHIKKAKALEPIYSNIMPKFRSKFIELACYGYWYTPESQDGLQGNISSKQLQQHISKKKDIQTKVIFAPFDGALQLTNPEDKALSKEETEEYNERNLLDLHKYCGTNPNNIRGRVNDAITTENLDEQYNQAALDHSMLVMNLFEMATTASLVNRMTHPVQSKLHKWMRSGVKQLSRPALQKMAAKKFISQKTAKLWARRSLILANEVPDIASAALGSVLFSAVGEVAKMYTPYKSDYSQYNRDMRAARKDGVITVAERADAIQRFLWEHHTTGAIMGFGLFYVSPKVQKLFIKNIGKRLGYAENGRSFGMQQFEMLKHTRGFKSAWHEFPLTGSRLLADTLIFGSMPYVERAAQKIRHWDMENKQDDLWQGWDAFGYDYTHGFMVGAFFTSSQPVQGNIREALATRRINNSYKFFGLPKNATGEQMMQKIQLTMKMNDHYLEHGKFVQRKDNQMLRQERFSENDHYRMVLKIRRHMRILDGNYSNYGRMKPIGLRDRYIHGPKQKVQEAIEKAADWYELGVLNNLKTYYEHTKDGNAVHENTPDQ